MKIKYIFMLLALLATVHGVQAQEAVVALNLGPAATHPPVTDSDWKAGLTLDHFLRTNGENIPTTPTDVSLVWDRQALYIRFRCADPDPVYRNSVRLPRTDRVEVGLTASVAGQPDLWKFSANENGPAQMMHGGQTSEFTGAKVQIGPASWTAPITIPWSQIGGSPSKSFSLQLARNREITGEVLSPSALDYHEDPVQASTTDEFMEVALGGTKKVQTAGLGLITLPSGIQRWDRRAVVQHATTAECRELANLQQELASSPTTKVNLAGRVRLAEIWYDLLTQEGFSFYRDSGQWRMNPGQPDPWDGRHQFNEALRSGDISAASGILDSLLQHFGEVSSSWFADGTPGNVREIAWAPVTSIVSGAVVNNELVLRIHAGKDTDDLIVSFPSLGGVRIHGPAKGYFAPAALAPIQFTQTRDRIRAAANHLTVDVVFKNAWHIDVRSADSSQPVWTLREGDLSVLHDDKATIQGIDLRGDLHPAEKIFGLGERFDALDQRGKVLTLWQTDAWESTVLGGLSNQAYKPIPFWHSTTGYSVFWNTAYSIRADFGATQPDRYRITAQGPIFDLYLWSSDNASVLPEYAALTGKPLLPPAWAFEPWMGGGMGRWARNENQPPTQAMLEVVARFRQLDIPHSSIYAEGKGSEDPLIYRKLLPMDIHILTWARSQPLDWKMSQIQDALPGVPDDQLPLMRSADGKVYRVEPPDALWYQFPYFDFTAPKGIDLLRAYWKWRLDLGVAGTMVDFSDLVPRTALFYNKMTGEEMHNWYVHFYDHAVHEVFHERRGDDFILFARAADSGSQVDAGQMAGDHASNFRGLDESLTGGLSVSTSGFSNWGSDIGGYQGKPDEEVYLRWIEFGALSPLMRFHGTEPREPWYYSDASIGVYKKYAWLRENLLPYIYGSAQETQATGLPMMRLLPSIAADEYQFGDDLLVAPVLSPGQHRSVTLPPGHWADLWTGAPVSFGKSDLTVPIDQIPVYLRAGALLPLAIAPDFVLGESMSAGRVSALLVTPPDGAPVSHAWKLSAGGEYVRLASKSDTGGFSVTVENWHELHYLLVSGLRTPVTSVTADGEALQELDEKQTESFPPGWHRGGYNKMIVRLPACQKQEVHISTP
jgi:alpha-glucosidase (family GH31 glycosyl hydrolase)